MKRPFLAAVAAAALVCGLSACATATPYQPLNPANADAGGYHDTKVDSNHWRVSFGGNSVTQRDTVERYLLYRAAELTVNQGFDWFLETDKHTEKTTDVYFDPYIGYGYGYGWAPYWRVHRRGVRGGFYGGFYGGWGPGWNDGYGAWGPDWGDSFDRYDVSAEIMLGRGPKPAQALDAHEVMMNLGPGILRPLPPPPPKG